MAQVVNDRDVLIMAATPRFTAATDQGMFVTPSTAIFKMSANGATAAPSQFVFKANLLNITGNVSWSYTGVLSPVINGNTLTLDYASFTSVSATITASITVDGQQYSATSTVTKLADGSTGQNGTRGSNSISAATGSSTWVDAEAVAAVQSAGFAPVVVRDAVTLYNNATKFYERRYWSGSTWIPFAERIPGNLLVDGSVATQALAAGAVTTDKLLVGNKGGVLSDDPMLEDVANAWIQQPGIFVDTNGYTAPKAVGGRYFSSLTIDARVYSARTFRIDPARTYSLTANLFAAGGNNRWIILYLDFYDALGAFVSTTWGGTESGYTYTGLPPTGTWSRQGGQFGASVAARQIPQNVAYARVGVWFQYSGNGSGITNQDAQDIRLEEVSSGVLIEDGAIKARHIQVDSISATSSIIGMLRTATTGARIEISDNLIEGFASNNVKRFRISAS